MAQTLPIPAGQPLDATQKAAGQVVTLAGAEAVAVQAAASLTLAALLWPLIPAARAMAGLAARWAHGCRYGRSRTSRSRSCPDRAVQDGPRRCPAARQGRCARPARSRWG